MDLYLQIDAAVSTSVHSVVNKVSQCFVTTIKVLEYVNKPLQCRVSIYFCSCLSSKLCILVFRTIVYLGTLGGKGDSESL